MFQPSSIKTLKKLREAQQQFDQNQAELAKDAEDDSSSSEETSEDNIQNAAAEPSTSLASSSAAA